MMTYYCTVLYMHTKTKEPQMINENLLREGATILYPQQVRTCVFRTDICLQVAAWLQPQYSNLIAVLHVIYIHPDTLSTMYNIISIFCFVNI